MPHAAPKLCPCGYRVPPDVRCPCRQKADAARKAEFDRKRPSSSARGYTGKWDAARATYLARNSFCRRCGKPATVVDHIIPHRGDTAVFWDKSNWQPLCAPCHNGSKQRQERRATKG